MSRQEANLKQEQDEIKLLVKEISANDALIGEKETKIYQLKRKT